MRVNEMFPALWKAHPHNVRRSEWVHSDVGRLDAVSEVLTLPHWHGRNFRELMAGYPKELRSV